MKRLTGTIRSLYLQSRTLTAVVLVILITLAGVIDNSGLQLSAAVALLALILQVIFGIDQKLDSSSRSAWYPTFQEALPHMTGEIERRLRRGPVRMRWIGVTHEAGWPFSQNILLKVLDGHLGEAASVSIELAALDPDGDICRRPDGPDQNQVTSTKNKISNFIESHKQSLATHNSRLSLYLYDHRPTWHALLIDSDLLYYSAALPKNLPFASPQGGVEVVSIDSGEAELARVRHFVSWFDSIAVDAKMANKFVGLDANY